MAIFRAFGTTKKSECPFQTLSQFLGNRAHTKGVGATTRLLGRVLRRVLETAFEKVLRRVLRRRLAVGFRGRKGSKKGS